MTQQLSLSQEQSTIIDNVNKTITLNEYKALEVSKIISNEERQFKRILELEKALAIKDSIINEKDAKIKDLIGKTNTLGLNILDKEKQINSLLKNEVNYLNKKNYNGIYGGGYISQENFYLGASYIKDNMKYSALIGTQERSRYLIGVGVKIL